MKSKSFRIAYRLPNGIITAAFVGGVKDALAARALFETTSAYPVVNVTREAFPGPKARKRAAKGGR